VPSNFSGRAWYGPALGVNRTSRSCIGVALAPVLSTCPSLLWSYFHVHLLLLILLLLAHRYAILWTERRSAPCLKPIVGAPCQSRPSLLQDSWSVFRRTPIPSGLGSEASYVDGASFHGGYGGKGYHLPQCKGVRGGKDSSRLHFSVGSATCFGLPSKSTRRAVGCLVTVYSRSA